MRVENFLRWDKSIELAVLLLKQTPHVIVQVCTIGMPRLFLFIIYTTKSTIAT